MLFAAREGDVRRFDSEGLPELAVGGGLDPVAAEAMRLPIIRAALTALGEDAAQRPQPGPSPPPRVPRLALGGGSR